MIIECLFILICFILGLRRNKLNHKIDIMKSKIYAIIFIAIFSVGDLFAQVDPNDPNYQNLKETGQLPPPPEPGPMAEPIPTMAQSPSAPGAGLVIPLDGTFIQAMLPNDDNSAGPIALPFTFCFYSNNETSFYINNNGNVSFGASYSQYSPSGFPLAGFPMLAPFWGDVDTRTCGNVWYKIETSPYRVTVIWELVGYYNQHCDKLNYFELIFTDGNDPLIGMGNNVSFSYEDMQWTTGGASGGTGGFGGYPATVGINSGDGVNYALIGRFDHAGSDYDGPGGNVDGVDYLDTQSFVFNTCNASTNIPPVPAGFPGGPVTVNVGQTYNLTVQFLSPEVGQTVNTVVIDGGISDFTYTSTPGNPSSISIQLIGTASNLGSHTIQFIATDDGVPIESTTVNLDINVQNGTPQVPISNWAIIISVILIGTVVWFKRGNLFS